MAFGKGRTSISLKEDILNKVSEFDILSYYLKISNIPCLINSPLRRDEKPSLGLYSYDGIRIFYIDFSTGDKGGIFDLLGLMWNCGYSEVLNRIYKDIINKNMHSTANNNVYISGNNNNIKTIGNHKETSDLKCKIREWKDYDIEYWESYGIELKWLMYADVYPISHKIVVKNNNEYIFKADKYAYVYVERKEGKITLKIYQPFNKVGYKWSNKHDMSVISLWTKVPLYGERLCICSSLKDALCLWANTGIPSLAVQGEGYKISNTAINELKRRYKRVFILFDNDNAGLIDGNKLANETGFTNIILPRIKELNDPKDISDLYHALKDKKKFKEVILNLFN